MRLNKRQIAAVLAGLRALQSGNVEQEREWIETEPLSDDEIDALCDAINEGGLG